MNRQDKWRFGPLSACMMVAALGFASSATAVDPPDAELDFDAGVACAFPLHVEIRGGNNVFREFTDKNGDPIRILIAGKGSALSFTNMDTGAALSLKAKGAVQHITFNQDGSLTIVTTGHNVISLTPSDVPAGPSTILYEGRTVATVNGSVGTIESVSGKQTDICAALS